MMTLIVTGAAVVFLLAACGSDKDKSKDSSSDSKTDSSSTTEAVSSASVSDKPDVLKKALASDGKWIVAATADVTFDEDVTVSGEFHDKGESSGDIYRKLALYSQDDDYNVTAEYTLTVPELVVESENFNIVHGTIKGDIVVKANGFVLDGTKVDGKVTFDKEEYKTSATLDKDGAEVTGEVTVK